MISTRGRYALRVMLDLAEHRNGGYLPMKEVAQRQEISLKYLERILPLLTKQNLVEGQHGVIELTESRVRLRTGRGVLTVQGEGLRLRALSVDAALIEGHVLTATYAGGGRAP